MGFHTFQELSDEDLDRIERRSEAATVGPWFSYVAGRDEEAAVNCIELGTCNELGSCRTIELAGATVEDQEFIANARQDLPRLVREVRMLRARLQAQVSTDAELLEPGASARTPTVTPTRAATVA